MQCGAVIVAAGTGERLGHSERKAWVPLGGEPLVAHSLRALGASSRVTRLVVAAHADDVGRMIDLVRALGIEAEVVAGGRERQDSVLAGVRALGEACEGVLIHDAARPFVTEALIERLALGLENAAAVVPVERPTSTVKRIAEDVVLETVDRAFVGLAQTPQAVRRDLLLAALESARRDGVTVTDDVQAIERTGNRVVAVPAERFNLKITTPSDLAVAEFILQQKIWSD